RVGILRKDLLHQFIEALVEFRAATAGLGKDETPLLDVAAEVLLAFLGEFGGDVAVEEENGSLEKVFNGGDVGVDDLPGDQAFPVTGDDVDEVADVVGVVVPVIPRTVAKLVDDDGRAAFGQEEDREAGGNEFFLLVKRAAPEALELVLVVDEFLSP